MRLKVVIPARFASTRFPGKPLHPLRGATGLAKTLLARTLEAATAGAPGQELIVATDDDRVAAEAARCGTPVAITPSTCRNGTERIAAALPQIGAVDVVLNVQGDALLTPPQAIATLSAHMCDAPQTEVATVALRCNQSMLDRLLADRAAGRVGGTTVVANQRAKAQYFSKHVLPFGAVEAAKTPVLLHLGLYAYRPHALELYREHPESTAEAAEGLEQLRFLDGGVPISVLVLDPPGWDAMELNNREDISPIENVLAARGIV